jgi:hypothetical protein
LLWYWATAAAAVTQAIATQYLWTVYVVVLTAAENLLMSIPSITCISSIFKTCVDMSVLIVIFDLHPFR